MKVKKAIEFLKAENIIRLRSAIDTDLLTENYKEIIKLLQQGEKYRQRWEKFKKKYGSAVYLHNYDDGLKELMNDFEQKYFPKEANNINENIKSG